MSWQKTVKGILFRPLTGLILVTIVALLTGFKYGAALGSNPDDVAGKYTTPRISSPQNQHNALLIHVDKRDPEGANLKSVWLMAYYANSSRVDLLPIFPLTKLEAVEPNASLANRFNLTEDGEPGDAFWDEMRTIKTWWNAYILMDDIATQRLREHLVDPGGIGYNEPAGTTGWEHDPQAAVKNEAALYSALCQDFPQNAGVSNFFSLLLSIKGHVQTNLKPGELYDIWQMLAAYGQDLNCSFPSLYSINP